MLFLAQAVVNAQRASDITVSLLPGVQSRDSQKLASPTDSSAAVNLHGSQSLLPALSTSSDEVPGIHKPSQSLFDSLPQKSRVLASRAISSTTPSVGPDMLSQDPPATSTSPSAFNPPPGSRLLAFGARVPPTATTPTDTTLLKTHPSADSMMSHHSSLSTALPNKPLNTIPVKTDITLMGANQHGLSNLGQSPTFGSTHSSSPQPGPEWVQEYSFSSSGAGWSPDEAEQRAAFLRTETLRRTPVSALGDRTQVVRGPELGQPDLNDRMGSVRRAVKPPNADRTTLTLGGDFGSSYSDLAGPAHAAGNFSPGGSIDLSGNMTGVSPVANKGSRFAKFFDAKSREQQTLTGQKTQQGQGYVSTSPHPGGSRPDINALNGMMPTHGESRAMEDIFAMLQNSAQVCQYYFR